MPFEFKSTGIPDVVLVMPKVFKDERGFFLESYQKEQFESAGIAGQFIQDNHSRSGYGVLRGLHFQTEPYAQAKLVQCVRGVVFDVAVDLRGGSSSYGGHVWAVLSEHNHHLLYVPKGFAHGFCVLSDVAEVHYKVDAPYAPEHEEGLLWNDPDLAIPWPIDEPFLSAKDEKWHCLRELR